MVRFFSSPEWLALPLLLLVLGILALVVRAPKSRPPAGPAAGPDPFAGKVPAPPREPAPRVRQTLLASWYGEDHRGRTTASGAPFDPDALTCAHRYLPFGTPLRLTVGRRTVDVTVNDRGPYVAGRDLDLSQAAAERLGMVEAGLALVDVEVLR